MRFDVDFQQGDDFHAELKTEDFKASLDSDAVALDADLHEEEYAFSLEDAPTTLDTELGEITIIKIGDVVVKVAETDEGAEITVTDATGTQSATIYNGADGKDGAQGPTGATGPQGPKGDTGPAGPHGPVGEKGADGAQGPQGEKGDTGERGPTGPAGADGAQGPKGDTGAQGAKGDTGPQGERGPKGDTGNTGPAGPQGEKGDTGPQGEAGPKGDTGPAGEQGAAGPQGPKGDTGAQGPAGADGVTPDIQIGTVETLDAGSDATASITGTAEAPLLNLGIPRGSDGDAAQLLQVVYPVGSIYLSTVAANPATLFGFGTWTQVKDRFLLAAGDSYAAGATGGEATHKLTVNELPDHKHYIAATSSGLYDIPAWTLQLKSGSYTAPSTAQEDVGCGYSVGIVADPLGQAHNNMPPYLAVYVWQRIS